MNTSTNNNTSQPLPYLLARLAIAASMFGHGLVRLPKLQGLQQLDGGELQHVHDAAGAGKTLQSRTAHR